MISSEEAMKLHIPCKAPSPVPQMSGCWAERSGGLGVLRVDSRVHTVAAKPSDSAGLPAKLLGAAKQAALSVRGFSGL